MHGVDHHMQIRRLRELMADWGEKMASACFAEPHVVAERLGLAPRKAPVPSIVVGDDLGAELGQPGSPSHAIVLSTRRTGLVQAGSVHLLGADLPDCHVGRPRSFAQVVVLELADQGEAPTQFELQSQAFLSNRLPGVMARTVPGRLWLRFTRGFLEAGFGLVDLGAVLISAFLQDNPGVTAAEVLLIGDRPEAVSALDGIAAEVRVLSGAHDKLTLVGDSELECTDLDCESCEHKDLCDALRDVTVRYRERKREDSA